MNMSVPNGTTGNDSYVFAMTLEELRTQGMASLTVGSHTVALVLHEEKVYAVDNRCPHMGFPLDRGSVRNGILTCHWHHARFDLKTGGAFDLWADDTPAFPVEVRDGEIWVDVTPQRERVVHAWQRLGIALERGLSLVIGKSVILLEERHLTRELIQLGVEFGCQYREAGWGQGLTILGCMANLLPDLAPDDRARALFHGLAAVAAETTGAPYRYRVRPLPDEVDDRDLLMAWFREFIEVRDFEGAERCLASAIRGGADPVFLMDMLAAAALDHRYIDIGHPMDFTNKAFQLLDKIGWDSAELVLSSLVRGYAMAQRMEERHAWRHPIDLIVLLEDTFQELEDVLQEGETQRATWQGDPELVSVILTAEPAAMLDYMCAALRQGLPPVELAVHVCFAAAMRIAQFHTSNEIADWDTALHTFTFSNAVLQAYKRASTVNILRGVFDAAMSVYLDRFLNIPAARIPTCRPGRPAPDDLLQNLGVLLDHQYQVTQAAELVADYTANGRDVGPLRTSLGYNLLREDRDFHTIQCVEASFALHDELRTTYRALDWLKPNVPLIAAARYLAAHTPTMRSQGQTYNIALRLHRGEHIFEG